MGLFRIRSGQSLTDVAIEVYGSAEAVFVLLEDNPLLAQSIDAIPSPGSKIIVRDTNPVSPQASFVRDQLSIDRAKIGSAPSTQTAPSGYVQPGYVQPGYVD